MGLQTCQNVCREKSSGRALSVAYAHSFGEGGSGGSAPYFLASAFDKVSQSKVLGFSKLLDMHAHSGNVLQK